MRYITILLLFSTLIFAQKVKVTFSVMAENVETGEKVYIAGSVNDLGNWQPGKVPLKQTGKTSWEISVEFPPGLPIEFKFTKGAWENEALDSNMNIPKNNYLKTFEDTTVVFSITHWKDEIAAKQAAEGQITGKVEYYRDIRFGNILPRGVIVWLPPEYDKNSAERFPVLYMHDGQNIIDPLTSSFGIDWRADESADSLIRNHFAEPFIIVGIYNTRDRSADYSPGEKGSEYMKSIVEKIKPMIDNDYRTKPDRDNTAVAGSSMGGLISFMLIWNYPEIFSKAACFSPAFKYQNFDYADYISETPTPEKDLLIYIDNGGIGLDELLQPGVNEMLAQLKKRGFEENINLFYVKSDSDSHNETAWANRLPKVMKLFYGVK